MNLNENTKPSGPPRFPRGVYSFRITEQPEYKVSKAGNDMLVFKLECDGPASLIVDGAERDMRGYEFTVWAVWQEGGNQTLRAIHAACNLPMEFDVDEETHLPVGINYVGQALSALAASTETDMLDENKEIIRHPTTGQPLKQQRRNIIQIL